MEHPWLSCERSSTTATLRARGFVSRRGNAYHALEDLGEERLSALVLGVGKHLARVARLHNHTAVHQHERVGDLTCLAR